MSDPLALAAEGEALAGALTPATWRAVASSSLDLVPALCAAVRELVAERDRLDKSDAMRHDDVVILYDRAMQAEAKRDALAEALRDWLKAYDDTGPDNGPSLTEHACAARARAALAKLDLAGSEDKPCP